MYGNRRKATYRRPVSSGGTFRRAFRVSVARKKFTPKGRVAKRLNRREIKYDDDYYSMSQWQTAKNDTATTGANWINYVLGGIVLMNGSNSRITNGAASPTFAFLTQATYAPNCLTNVDSGTTAKTRIGNVIQPRFINVRGVIEASKTNVVTDAETTVNQEALDITSPAAAQTRYVRTSIRIYILRDKSMNENGFVRYEDVFEPPDVNIAVSATNPFLWQRKVDRISRYEILKTLTYELDQDDPQRSFVATIPLKGVAIRFNGSAAVGIMRDASVTSMYQSAGGNTTAPGWLSGAGTNDGPNIITTSSDNQSMTNGIYILAVSHTCLPPGISNSNMVSPSITFSSRLTFED